MEEHSLDFELIVEGSVEGAIAALLVVDDGEAPASQMSSNLVVQTCLGEKPEPCQSGLRMFAQGHV